MQSVQCMGLGLHTGAWEYGLEALGWELTSLACFFWV